MEFANGKEVIEMLTQDEWKTFHNRVRNSMNAWGQGRISEDEHFADLAEIVCEIVVYALTGRKETDGAE